MVPGAIYVVLEDIKMVPKGIKMVPEGMKMVPWGIETVLEGIRSVPKRIKMPLEMVQVATITLPRRLIATLMLSRVQLEAGQNPTDAMMNFIRRLETMHHIY